MRTTLELLKLLESDRLALYNFTFKEKLSVRGLSYKIINKGHISYFMVIRLTKLSSYLMSYEEFNVLSLTFVNDYPKPWINLTVYSKDNSMFRGILHDQVDVDSMWLKVYSIFRKGKISKDMFIYFCRECFNISQFEWS